MPRAPARPLAQRSPRRGAGGRATLDESASVLEPVPPALSEAGARKAGDGSEAKGHSSLVARPAASTGPSTTETPHRFVVSPADAGQRLDRYLADRLPDLSRTRIQALVAAGAVRVSGHAARPALKVAAGDEIAVAVPPPVRGALAAEPLPLRIIYEDADLLVVDKPAGLVVHPAPGHPSGTLVNALLAHCPDLARDSGRGAVGGELRPGIVHRLDKDTSGLMVVAKHAAAHRFLAAQLKARQMDKRYLALVDGAPRSESGTIDSPVGRHPRRPQQMAVVAGGRPATTQFRVLGRLARHTLLECRPVTGRTHQIRVHLAAIGCPVAGDRRYGATRATVPLERHFLHASRLTFRLPSDGVRTFVSPLPPDLQAALDALKGERA